MNRRGCFVHSPSLVCIEVTPLQTLTKQVGVQPPTAARNVALLAFAAERRAAAAPLLFGSPAVQQSRNFSCQLGAQQQTRRTLLQRSIAGTDRRSWRTPCRYIDPVTYDTSSDSIAVPTREMKYVEKRTWNRIGLYMRNKTNGNIYFVSHLFFCKVRSVLWHCWLGARKSIRFVKIEWRGAGVVW